MECTNGSTQVLYMKREKNIIQKTDYEVDFWEEIKKRWMILGVLISVALAVLTSHYGASGGLFHTQYIVYLPLSYIYYTAGRTRMYACRTRLYILTVLHAHVIGLALSVVSVNALAMALDRRVIEGAILASIARPCAWLPLSFSKDGITPTIAAINYAISFIFSPFPHLFFFLQNAALISATEYAMPPEFSGEWETKCLNPAVCGIQREADLIFNFLLYFLFQCGRIPLPTSTSFIVTVGTSVIPFAFGSLSHKAEIDTKSTKISALIVLYTECCNLLTEAEGSLYVIDVMATLFLVISWLSTVAASSYLYVKCGWLTTTEAEVLLLIATPKSTHIEWISHSLCASGLARLPAVFIAPAQALLLAAITSDNKENNELPR